MKGAEIISQKELALQMVQNLSEKKAAALVVFLKDFASAETEQIEHEKKQRAFEELKAMIKPLGLEDNDKEVLQKHREEKYGS